MDVGACVTSFLGVSPDSAPALGWGALLSRFFRREPGGPGVPLPAQGERTRGDVSQPLAFPAIIGEWEFGKFPN